MLDESQARTKITGGNINNLRHADDTTLMAESEEELKSLLMRMKEEWEKSDLKCTLKKKKTNIIACIQSHHLQQIEGRKMETVTDFIFLGSKITADSDCSHEN